MKAEEQARTAQVVELSPGRGGVGGQLRAARLAMGLTVEQVSQDTRISRRHVENIEAGNFAELPGRPYAIGFAKTYARLVGLDQRDVATMVGTEMEARQPAPAPRPKPFEPGDPARVPSARLGIVSLLAVVLLLTGLFFVARLMFAPAAELPSLVDQEEAERAERARAAAANAAPPGAQRPAAAAPAGPVVFTALEEGIWVKFYDASGAQLMQKLMARGESYTVPADAEGPQLWTGRPDALSITIGGRDVPRLAEDVMIMRDVPVTAEALLARSQGVASGEQGGSGQQVERAPAAPQTGEATRQRPAT